MNEKQRYNWTNQLTFIISTAGAAIGLGNIWRFPCAVYENDGSPFILAYLILLFIFGVPLLIAEILIGKVAKKNPISSIEYLSAQAKVSRNWVIFGWLGLLGLFLTLSFYSVVAGWTLFYLANSIIGNFIAADLSYTIAKWNMLITTPSNMILFHSIFLFFTFIILALGLNSGIENLNIIAIPLLYFCLFLLLIYVAMNTGESFYTALKFLFVPNFNITSKTILKALGQVFFSLAIGAGAMLMYGSYLTKKVNVVKSVFNVVICQFLVGIFISIIITSIIFANNLSFESGTSLAFITLPIAFATMKFGHFFEIMFFALLFFSAWTSSINMAEPLIATLNERFDLSRKISCIIMGLLTCFIGTVLALSFNIFSFVKIFDKNLFDITISLITNIILPVGGIFYSIYVGWILYDKKIFRREVQLNNTIEQLFFFLIRYVTPIGLALIMIF